MRVSIEYCVVCNYEPRATGLLAELRAAYSHADIELIESAGAVFEVQLDGRLIFSKKKLRRHAEPGEILRAIASAYGPPAAR